MKLGIQLSNLVTVQAHEKLNVEVKVVDGKTKASLELHQAFAKFKNVKTGLEVIVRSVLAPLALSKQKDKSHMSRMNRSHDSMSL